MMVNVGSIDSSDLMINVELNSNKGMLKITNLVPEIEDVLIIELVLPIINEFNLQNLKIKIFYNGANGWVIRSRFEALSILIKEQNLVREGELLV
ncbi:hypothetical protein I6G82_02140 [Lysinibacillus macroides]|uniref:Uncharacterized protein n=1 Tax=Lysinibacillus macroides TaxID=33935 RepID=A0A0N0CVA3_9BACI|nr:hypothetical protein [Lysinibacillus macroides]KOY81371.1 hypothetical protein ADM90_19815 [Lysinibacillus macroides]QPR68456.1 hypothetical protein I6G82_02140 [Lysinibacillus macroides]